MSETPTSSKPVAPGKGPAKRGGLALPPRGQALARLQDLEEEGEPLAPAAENPGESSLSTSSSNAVNTASSNAVTRQGSKVVQDDAQTSKAPVAPLQTHTTPTTSAPKAAVAVPDYQVPARAVREPTTRITVDMPDSLHQKISVLSAQTRRSIKDLVIEALATTYFGTGTDAQ